MKILTTESKNDYNTLNNICDKLLKFVLLPSIGCFIILMLSNGIQQSYDKRQSFIHKSNAMQKSEKAELNETIRMEMNDQHLTESYMIMPVGEYIALINHETEAKKLAMAQSMVKTREEKIKAQFDLATGSHHALEYYVKKHLQVPSSYVHIDTQFSEGENSLIVITKYRSNPKFGGETEGIIKAQVSLDGHILHVWK